MLVTVCMLSLFYVTRKQMSLLWPCTRLLDTAVPELQKPYLEIRMTMGNNPDTHHQQVANSVDRLLVQIHALNAGERFTGPHELQEISRLETVQDVAATAAGLVQYITRLLHVERAITERDLLERKRPGQGVH